MKKVWRLKSIYLYTISVLQFKKVFNRNLFLFFVKCLYIYTHTHIYIYIYIYTYIYICIYITKHNQNAQMHKTLETLLLIIKMCNGFTADGIWVNTKVWSVIYEPSQGSRRASSDAFHQRYWISERWTSQKWNPFLLIASTLWVYIHIDIDIVLQYSFIYNTVLTCNLVSNLYYRLWRSYVNNKNLLLKDMML